MDTDLPPFLSPRRATANRVGRVVSHPDSLDGNGSVLTPGTNRIRGRCLELGTTSGTWTELLELLATHVTSTTTATDEDPTEVPAAGFDTVVSGCTVNRLDDVAVTARHALRDDGSLLLAVDGWAKHLRVQDRSPVRAMAEFPRQNAWQVRRTLRKAGFAGVTLYGVFPSIAEPELIYPLSNDVAVEWLLERWLNGVTGTAAHAARAVGAFGRTQPGYLAVCDVTEDGSDPGTEVIRVSYNRTLTFELEDDGIARIRKAPRPGAGDTTIRREQRVLDDLREAGGPDAVVNTLPDGSLTRSPLGAVRHESPVAGGAIGDRLDADAASVKRVLDVAFDWLASFQRAFGGERVVREPDDLRRLARCPELDVTDPPGLDTSVSSFVTPSHGDFHPWNVHVDDDGVTGVIDWEYATIRGDAAVDPALFLLNVCAHLGKGFEAEFERLCASETSLSNAVRASLDRYCERVGLSRRSVVAALPYAHVHTVEMLRELGDPPASPELCRQYEPRLTAVKERFDDVVDTLG